MENNGKIYRKPGNLWDFSPFMGRAPANCPSSRAGRVEVVGMKKYWELYKAPHLGFC
jgi:hypothetical protein